MLSLCIWYILSIFTFSLGLVQWQFYCLHHHHDHHYYHHLSISQPPMHLCFAQAKKLIAHPSSFICMGIFFKISILHTPKISFAHNELPFLAKSMIIIIIVHRFMISFSPMKKTIYMNMHCWNEMKMCLTHWGRVTHICVGNLTNIGSDNGLSPGRRQAIIWTNAGILLIRTLGTNFSEILSRILTFSFKKMRLKVSSAKWRPFCLDLNVLKQLLYMSWRMHQRTGTSLV